MDASVDPPLRVRVELERVSRLFGGVRAVTESALLMVVVVGMIAAVDGSMKAFTIWGALVLLMQIFLIVLAMRFRTRVTAAHARRWAWMYAGIAALSGVIWGSAAFVIVPHDSTITLGLIAACLAARATVSVMTHSYFPPALHAFSIPVFCLLAARYALLGTSADIALAGLWLCALAYVLFFGVRQARAIAQSIELGDKNTQLVEALQTQYAAAEQALTRAEEASRSKSRFFAAANHDLRQPLHSLGLFATALKNNVTEPAPRKLIDQILQCTESLEMLFDNLLDISRLDAGQVEVRLETITASAVLERLRSTFLVPAREKGLELHVRVSKALITTDPTLLFRVLSNLVSNAIRYTETGAILIACRPRGRRVSFEVWDTGIGIAAEQHERIFEEFYQIQNPERDRRRGVGLGLATVRRIAHILGAPLKLRSKPGSGSMFALEVLRADAAKVQTTAATLEQKVPNLIGGKTIVVIDDEASVRLGMESLLESWGCKCITAAGTEEALRGISGRKPDFIIADLRLRGEENGIDAIRALRQALGETVPAVLVSGDTATEQLRKVSAAGLTMMHKPLKAVRLRALLNHEFARRNN